MTLRKITIDNSVKYVKKGGQSEQIKSVSDGGKSNSRKQNENLSQKNKKFIKNISGEGFRIIK